MYSTEKQSIRAPDFDQEGYLVRPDTWTRATAEALAQKEFPGGLTEDHWKVINFIREYYLEIGIVPPVRILSRRTGFTLSQIQKLFPQGLANSACKIAGVPKDAIKPSFLYP